MSDLRVDLSLFKNRLSWKNRLGRALWMVTWSLLFLPFFLPFCNGWRCFLLRLFGAKIHAKARIYSSVKVWAPWHLEVGSFTLIGPGVNIYNVGPISIGAHTVISQRAYLCTGTHDITKPSFPLLAPTLTISDQVWIAAEAFVGGMHTVIGQGAVVGARACVFKNVDPWTVVGGNPAVSIKKRMIQNG